MANQELRYGDWIVRRLGRLGIKRREVWAVSYKKAHRTVGFFLSEADAIHYAKTQKVPGE